MAGAFVNLPVDLIEQLVAAAAVEMWATRQRCPTPGPRSGGVISMAVMLRAPVVGYGVLYALHGFIKKTKKTPDEELAIARKRKREVEDG